MKLKFGWFTVNRLLQVATPVLLVGLWWLYSSTQNNPFVPPVPDVLRRFQELWMFEHFVSDVLPTLGVLVLGFVISGAAGILLGMLFYKSPVVSELISPIIHIYRAIPAVAIIPVFISLLGFGIEVSLIVIVLAAFPPTWIATLDGLKAIDPSVHELCRVYRFRQGDITARVLLPAASPQIFSGLKVSLQFSFIVVIATEMLGSSSGIGALTILAQQSFQAADMWAGVLLLGIIGVAANLLFDLLGDTVLRWYRLSKEHALTA